MNALPQHAHPQLPEPASGDAAAMPGGPDSRRDKRVELQARINQLQGSRLGSTRLPTVPALARLLPGGGLQAGGTYAVHNSTTLAMALLAGPSMTGAWGSVVGLPFFNVEAAAGFGIDLSRLVLVPHPDRQWLSVTAAMVDVVSIILTSPPKEFRPSDAARLRARMRQRGAALIAMGSWPQSDATLRVSSCRWDGLGQGTGHLRARRLTVTARGQVGRPRSADVWLEDLQRGPWPLTTDGSAQESRTADGSAGLPAGRIASPTEQKEPAQLRLVGL